MQASPSPLSHLATCLREHIFSVVKVLKDAENEDKIRLVYLSVTSHYTGQSSALMAHSFHDMKRGKNQL